MERRRIQHATVLTLAATLLLSCTGSTDESATTTIPTTTTIAPQRVQANGVLTFGLLLPESNPTLGEGLIGAANVAIQRINEAGGVLGRQVQVVAEDEGLDPGAASASIAALVDPTRRVDAVIGPASSLTALNDLDALVTAGIVSCSPTATALALDDYPDERLFFRTVPSDSLQAVAIADLAERTGVSDVSIVYVDDAYGRPFAEAVDAALTVGSRSVSSIRTFGFMRSDGDLADLANTVATSGAPVVIVLAGSDDGAAFLEALDDTEFDSLTDVIVNDSMRDAGVAQRIEGLDADLRARVRGVGPQAQSNDPERPFDPPGPFAAQAFDCVNLIALAAYSVDSDDPAVFASQIPALTVGGRVCTTFASCIELLDQGLDINYNGPDGITELLVAGEPSRARFDIFSFDETGRAAVNESQLATQR